MRISDWSSDVCSSDLVDHLCGKVMKRAFVGAADIHAGAAANGFEPLENLDLRGVVAVGRGRGVVEQIVTHAPAIGGRKPRWQGRFSAPPSISVAARFVPFPS